MLSKYFKAERTEVVIFLWVICLANLCIAAAYVWLRTSARPAAPPTYRGSDFPEHLPVSDYGSKLPVLDWVFQEAPYYPLIRPWSWTTDITNNEPSNGIVRLGPNNRVFAVTMWHQLHCLNTFNQAFAQTPRPHMDGHMQHCLNYLRQTFLCEADLNIEPGDFEQRNFTSDVLHEPTRCRDWTLLLNEVEGLWLAWNKYKKVNQSTSSEGGSES